MTIYIYIYAIKRNHLGVTRTETFYKDLSKKIFKGLELTLEPTIGNYDQKFVDNWYTKIEQLSIILMKDVATFCENTGQKKQNSINEIEVILKQQLKKDDFEKIQKTITSNETATK